MKAGSHHHLGKTESILPRTEQIPGETHHVGERIKAVILDVRRSGPSGEDHFVANPSRFRRRLFENEIPEIAERTIEIKAIAREAGYRAKIAVSSIDIKVDCVGAASASVARASRTSSRNSAANASTLSAGTIRFRS